MFFVVFFKQYLLQHLLWEQKELIWRAYTVHNACYTWRSNKTFTKEQKLTEMVGQRINDWIILKNITLVSKSSWEIRLRTNRFFSYPKHYAIYFWVIVQRIQVQLFTQQNLVNTENSVWELQQVHRKEDRLPIDNNVSEKGGISGN